jgi:hypothetical protein
MEERAENARVREIYYRIPSDLKDDRAEVQPGPRLVGASG